MVGLCQDQPENLEAYLAYASQAKAKHELLIITTNYLLKRWIAFTPGYALCSDSTTYCLYMPFVISVIIETTFSIFNFSFI